MLLSEHSTCQESKDTGECEVRLLKNGKSFV
jgi:hypothetical protein